MSFSLVNAVQGIAWRLGFGIEDPTQPEGKRTTEYLFFSHADEFL
jgi:hypothetical protein